MFRGSLSATVSTIPDTEVNPGLWSDSLVIASWTDEALLDSSRGDTHGHQSSLSSLRSLSLSVPVYERLIRENEERLQGLAAQSDRDKCIIAEYQYDINFLKDGLSRVIERLSGAHGVHCSQDVVEVLIQSVDPAVVQEFNNPIADRVTLNHSALANVLSSGLVRQIEATTETDRKGDQSPGRVKTSHDLIDSEEEVLSP